MRGIGSHREVFAGGGSGLSYSVWARSRPGVVRGRRIVVTVQWFIESEAESGLRWERRDVFTGFSQVLRETNWVMKALRPRDWRAKLVRNCGYHTYLQVRAPVRSLLSHSDSIRAQGARQSRTDMLHL